MSLNLQTRVTRATWCTALLLLSASAAFAQTTGFTYQGKLTDGGAPANGSYDLQFTLWDALTGGTQQPQPSPVTVTRSAVAVSGGVFTVQLDFSVNAFPGADRFLEISVRTAGGSTFTTLSPRQQISSTPYAIRTLNAGNADALSSACSACVQDSQINSIAGNKVNGAIPVSSVPAGSGSYIQNTTTTQAGANFNVSGDGRVDGILSGNTVNAFTQFSINGSRFVSAPGGINTFVGFGAGRSNTTGTYNSFFGQAAGSSNTTGTWNAFFGHGAGVANSTGDSNSFFGAYAGNTNNGGDNAFFGYQAGLTNNSGFANSFFGADAGYKNTGGVDNAFFGASAGVSNTSGNSNSFFGIYAGLSNTVEDDNTFVGAAANGAAGITNATAIGASASVTQSNSLVLGSINGVNGAAADTNVGIGTTKPNGLQIGVAVSETARNVNNVRLGVSNGTPRAIFEAAGASPQWEIDNNAGRFRIFNPVQERFTIDSSGRVGIGTTNPNEAQLQVEGGTGIGVSGRGNTNGLVGRSDNGNGVFGTSNTGYAGYFEGNVSVPYGTVCAANISCGSDARLKQNIRPLTYGLRDVLRLHPVRWQWKDTANTQLTLGLIAQEVNPVLPELILRNVDNKGSLGLNYMGLIPVLVKGIQEQEAEINKQQRQIEQLTREVRRLHAVNRARRSRR